MAIDPELFMTEDRVDATTLIGKRVWWAGLYRLDSFEVNGIDIVLNEAGDGLDVRIYGEDHNPWLVCSQVRAHPKDWAVDEFNRRARELAKEAEKNLAIMTFDIEAKP